MMPEQWLRRLDVMLLSLSMNTHWLTVTEAPLCCLMKTERFGCLLTMMVEWMESLHRSSKHSFLNMECL